MNIFLFIFSGFLGASIGSFLNVVLFRFGASTIHKGRSICLSCGEKLRARDLIPIFSYVFLGGKCRGCKTKISPQYILVEITMTMLGFLVFLTLHTNNNILFSMSHIVYYIILLAFLLLIAVYDFKHKIIPDEFSFSFAVLAFAGLFFVPGQVQIPGVLEILAGPIVALPCALLHYGSKGKWMGLGDAKLFLGIGWMLGLSLGISAFILSFWIGAIISIVILKFPKSAYSLNSQIPFAPFIIAATLLVFFTKIDVFGLSLYL